MLDIFGHELDPDIRSQGVRPELSQVVVEIAEVRVERQRVDPSVLRSRCKVIHTANSTTCASVGYSPTATPCSWT